MNKRVFKLNGKQHKSAIVYNKNLIISSKSHKDYDSFPKSKKEKYFIETLVIVPIDSINLLSANEKNLELVIEYTKENTKHKKLTLELNSIDDRSNLAEIISDIKGFKNQLIIENKNKPLLSNIGTIVFSILVIWVLYDMAIDIKNGVPFEATGRRAGIKILINKLAELLGANGVIIVGVMALVYLTYKALKRFRNPANVTEYR